MFVKVTIVLSNTNFGLNFKKNKLKIYVICISKIIPHENMLTFILIFVIMTK